MAEWKNVKCNVRCTIGIIYKANIYCICQCRKVKVSGVKNEQINLNLHCDEQKNKNYFNSSPCPYLKPSITSILQHTRELVCHWFTQSCQQFKVYIQYNTTTHVQYIYSALQSMSFFIQNHATLKEVDNVCFCMGSWVDICLLPLNIQSLLILGQCGTCQCTN